MGTSKRLLRVKHCGRLGDVVYSVMVLKSYADRNDLQLEYCLWDNPALKNLSDEGHLYPGGINDAAYDFIKPWLEHHEIACRKYNGEVSLDLDTVKEYGASFGLPYSDIRKWYQYAFPEFAGKNYYNLNYRSEVDYDLIVVNRTQRWQNVHIDYTWLNAVENEIIFIGTYPEYDEFVEMVPRAKKVEIKTLLDAENLIRSCGLYIGNQSLFYAIAEFNQVKRMLEVCPQAPNVISQGNNHHDFITNQGFQYYLKTLLDANKG